jgi:hypothetical protein
VHYSKLLLLPNPGDKKNKQSAHYATAGKIKLQFSFKQQQHQQEPETDNNYNFAE